MHRITQPLLLGAALLLPSLAGAQDMAPRQLVEDKDKQFPIRQVVPHRSNQGFGTPRAIQVDIDGDGDLDAQDEVFLFTTGLRRFTPAPPELDQLFLWRAPNTWLGINSPFTNPPHTSEIKLLPQAGSCPVACEQGVHYGHAWPYMHDGELKVLAGIDRPVAGKQHHWHEVILGTWAGGTSTNFTWERFLRLSDRWNLLRFAWKEMTLDGQQVFWGFAEQAEKPTPGSSGQVGLTGVRYRPVQDILEVYTNSGWTNVPKCTAIGDTSGYRFCLYTNPADPVASRIETRRVAGTHGQRFPSLHALGGDLDKLELWATDTIPGAEEKVPCGLDNTPDPANDKLNGIVYRRVVRPTSLSDLPQLEEAMVLRQEGRDPARCNPHMRRDQRKGSFRLDWEPTVLYARSWDLPSDPIHGAPFCCQQGSNPGHAEGYITRTLLTSLLADDFDAGNLALWTTPAATGGASAVVSAAARFGGSGFGLRVSLPGTAGATAQVLDDSPAGEQAYWVRFNLRNNLSLANDDSFQILTGLEVTGGSETKVLRLNVKRNAMGTYILAVYAREDDGSWSSPVTDVLSAQNEVTIGWRAASAPGTNDGFLAIYRGGNLKDSNDSLDNDTRRIDRVRLGAVAGVPATATGNLDFDNFVSSQADEL